MKIEGRKSQQLGSLGLVSAPASNESAPVEETVSSGDLVDLNAAQQLNQLNAAVNALPEIRMDRVEGLRGAIEEGNYYVESEKLARKVVNNALADSLVQGRGKKEKR